MWFQRLESFATTSIQLCFAIYSFYSNKFLNRHIFNTYFFFTSFFNSIKDYIDNNTSFGYIDIFLVGRCAAVFYCVCMCATVIM